MLFAPIYAEGFVISKKTFELRICVDTGPKGIPNEGVWLVNTSGYDDVSHF